MAFAIFIIQPLFCMEKPADTLFPIHELLSRRWSPRAFAERAVESENIQRLLEAARWAPSCFNEQPLGLHRRDR